MKAETPKGDSVFFIEKYLGLHMKKFVNYRPLVVIAVSMVLATIFSVRVFEKCKTKLVCFLILIGIFACLVIVQLWKKKKFLYLIMASVFAMALPFGLIYLKCEKYAKTLVHNDEEFVIEGKIADNYKFTTSGNLSISLTNVKVVEGNLSKIDGIVTIYTNPNNFVLENFKVGRIIKVKTNLTFFNLETDSEKASSFLSRDNTCFGYANFYDVSFTDKYDISVRDEFCNKIFERLKQYNVKYSDVAYAMLFGESNYLDDEVKLEFRDTGIAHIVAVSGLHFSVIFGLILFLIDFFKLPVRKFIGLKILIIFLYCYLCKFSVSVVRAGLLAFFAILAKARGKAYDNMSCLSIVAMIFLIANPLTLFNLSFILSFSAVLSIALLTLPFEKLFSKIFKSKFSSVLAINCSVQVGLFAINMLYFGKFSCLGIFANLILIPIVSFSFILLFIGVLISGALPISMLLAKAYGILMDIVVKFNRYISKINYSLKLGNIHALAILFTFIFMFIISDYLFVSKKQKLIAGTVSLATLICFMFI